MVIVCPSGKAPRESTDWTHWGNTTSHTDWVSRTGRISEHAETPQSSQVGWQEGSSGGQELCYTVVVMEIKRCSKQSWHFKMISFFNIVYLPCFDWRTFSQFVLKYFLNRHHTQSFVLRHLEDLKLIPLNAENGHKLLHIVC